MPRRLLMSVLAAVVSLAGLLAPGTMDAANAANAAAVANAATPAACTGGVSVSQFAFNPPAIVPGGHSDLKLVLRNCGSQTVRGSTVWYGRYGYVGERCPVVDPSYPYPFTIAPGGSYTLTHTYGESGVSVCHASVLSITASVSVTGVGTVATPTAALHFIGACGDAGGVFQVDALDFAPVAVPPGRLSTATLILQNCTGQVVTGSTTWAPRLTWSGPDSPPGCPALDPVTLPYSVAPGAAAAVTLGLGDPVAGCPATALDLAVNVYETGVPNPISTSDVRLVIIQPTPDSCQVTYAPANWPGGFTADVTITNNGTAPINGWSLGFTFPDDQKITRAWNAAVTQTGADVTASNLSYNATIAPGASLSIGFQGTWAAGHASPTYFAVNGEFCY
ncbi:MAG: cellulose binding domain-containing protein [Catenulispora sp.]